MFIRQRFTRQRFTSQRFTSQRFTSQRFTSQRSTRQTCIRQRLIIQRFIHQRSRCRMQAIMTRWLLVVKMSPVQWDHGCSYICLTFGGTEGKNRTMTLNSWWQMRLKWQGQKLVGMGWWTKTKRTSREHNIRVRLVFAGWEFVLMTKMKTIKCQPLDHRKLRPSSSSAQSSHLWCIAFHFRSLSHCFNSIWFFPRKQSCVHLRLSRFFQSNFLQHNKISKLFLFCCLSYLFPLGNVREDLDIKIQECRPVWFALHCQVQLRNWQIMVGCGKLWLFPLSNTCCFPGQSVWQGIVCVLCLWCDFSHICQGNMCLFRPLTFVMVPRKYFFFNFALCPSRPLSKGTLRISWSYFLLNLAWQKTSQKDTNHLQKVVKCGRRQFYLLLSLLPECTAIILKKKYNKTIHKWQKALPQNHVFRKNGVCSGYHIVHKPHSDRQLSQSGLVSLRIGPSAQILAQICSIFCAQFLEETVNIATRHNRIVVSSSAASKHLCLKCISEGILHRLVQSFCPLSQQEDCEEGIRNITGINYSMWPLHTRTKSVWQQKMSLVLWKQHKSGSECNICLNKFLFWAPQLLNRLLECFANRFYHHTEVVEVLWNLRRVQCVPQSSEDLGGNMHCNLFQYICSRWVHVNG